MKRIALVLGAALLFLPALPSHAQLADIYQGLSSIFTANFFSGETAFRSLLIPMGGLQEAMGTAYTGVAKDASYFEANPAASSVLDDTELAVFHNNWIADSRIEGAVYTTRWNDFGFGAAGKWLYVPFPAVNDFGEHVGSGYYSEAMAGFNVSYNIFPGYYWSGIAAGLTGKIAYRSVPLFTSDFNTSNQNAAAFMIDAGLLTRFDWLKLAHWRGKNVSIGLALKNLGPPVMGEALPTVASFGIGYSPLRLITISLDIGQPINLVNPSHSESLTAAAGFLYDITDFFRLETGFLIKGGNPRLSVGATFDVELARIAVNYTLDLTTQVTPLNRISIMASFRLDKGARAALAKEVDQLYLEGMQAYAAGLNDEAVRLFKAAIALDPHFDPANEAINAISDQDAIKAALDIIGRQGSSSQTPTPSPTPPPAKP